VQVRSREFSRLSVHFCIKSRKNVPTFVSNLGQSETKWDKVGQSGKKWENEAGANAKTET
jgi:hypothetical protein